MRIWLHATSAGPPCGATPSTYNFPLICPLQGSATTPRPRYVIPPAGGVGYKVAVTRAAMTSFAIGTKIALWTHLAVREDILDLYGFVGEEELRFFEMLLTVSGIGPKYALAILDIAS